MGFEPPLPPQTIHVFQRMPMALSWKVLVQYDKPFWRDDGLQGEAVSPDGILSAIMDASPEDRSRGILMAFAVEPYAYHFADLDEKTKRKEVLAQLVACSGKKAANPARFAFHSMINEPWSTGCPVSIMGPGVWTTLGEWLRKPVSRVHCAGTETATTWSGYMEGSVRSGHRAADDVLLSLK
jgi:monoamine oxidase